MFEVASKREFLVLSIQYFINCHSLDRLSLQNISTVLSQYEKLIGILHSNRFAYFPVLAEFSDGMFSSRRLSFAKTSMEESVSSPSEGSTG